MVNFTSTILSICPGDPRTVRNNLSNYIKMCSSSVVFEKPEDRVKVAKKILDMCFKNGE